MAKIKDIPKIDRPRERFLKKGADALSKSDLLAILLGSGIKGKNVRQLSENIIKKFGKNFLNITVDDLLEISGIGQAKALQITAAISLVKRFYADEKSNELIVKNSQDVLSLAYDLRDKKKEHLVCLYLNARNSLLKKEVISVGLLDKTLLHPREIFYPATELNAASIILIHNHPSGDSSPSEKDKQIVEKITQAGEIMGIPVIDFIIISENGHYSFFEKLKKQKDSLDYAAEGSQASLFDLLVDANQAYSYEKSSSQDLPESKKGNNALRFIDFCAGIGAGRLGLQNLGLSCVGFSEIDKNSEKTYREFFGQEEKNYGDLMKINASDLPDFDLMIAGFPCQSFSVIGQRKGMCDRRGQIIYGLIKIMNAKNLPYFILENVKGLENHENGKTLKIILEKLDKAGYKVYHRVLSSLHYGVPQMRERIYFVGIRKDLVKENKHFEWPMPVKTPKIQDYLIDVDELELNEKKRAYKTFLKFLDNKYNKGLFNVEKLLKEDYLVLDTRQSDLRLYRGKVPTLRTGRHGILYIRNGKFRKLSGFESLLLQGFPKNLAEKVKGKVADVYLLSQAGNAMTINTIEAIGRQLLNYINN